MTASEIYDRAEKFYEERLKAELERTHMDCFIAIEPDSGDYFLGHTLTEAAAAAHAAYPDRRGAILRIGHSATVYMR